MKKDDAFHTTIVTIVRQIIDTTVQWGFLLFPPWESIFGGHKDGHKYIYR